MAINIRKTGELEDGSVSTVKIADAAVTLAKMAPTTKQEPYASDENEQEVLGVTETAIKEFTLLTSSSDQHNWQKMSVNTTMKTSNVANVATLKVYIDAEVSARETLTSSSATYETVESAALIDISDLANGAHTVTVKAYSDNASETAYNEVFEFYTYR